jgi:hypothetical protein
VEIVLYDRTIDGTVMRVVYRPSTYRRHAAAVVAQNATKLLISSHSQAQSWQLCGMRSIDGNMTERPRSKVAG